jgi:hypothetical protein
MNETILELKNMALCLIKDPNLKDATALARLGPIPSKLLQLEHQMADIDQELVRIRRMLDELAKPSQDSSFDAVQRPNKDHLPADYAVRGARKKIRIIVNWGRLGLPGGEETICDHIVADTYVHFITKLYTSKGLPILEKLAHLKINRGMFVSRHPDADYRNGSDPSGKPFQSQPIGDSGFHALTHSSTPEKITNIRRACQYLGLPIGSVQVSEVEMEQTVLTS